ncbi:unnamed protein product [Hymenolepis diminuta]|nr:unnamed protein product [Hymenolepis diminuta]
MSVVVYPQEQALPSQVRDLPSDQTPSQTFSSLQHHHQHQTSASTCNPVSGNKRSHKQRPMSFVLLGPAGRSGDTHDDGNLLLMPPINGSPPPAYSPHSRKNPDSRANHNSNT